MKGWRLRILSFSITCIFLCGAYSADGQDRRDEGPLERALRWEKAVFDADDPSSLHKALIAKAECYAEASCYKDALRTLDRIRLYLLSPEDLSEVLLFKARCCKETGDSGAALGYLEESGRVSEYPSLYSVLLASSWRFSEAKEWALRSAGEDSGLRDEVMRLFKKAPSLKKEGTAAVLSFIPPAGQIYLKEPGRGVASMILNAGAAAFTVVEILDHSWITGILGGGILLNETFFKANLSRNLSRVEEVNRQSVKEFADSLEALLGD